MIEHEIALRVDEASQDRRLAEEERDRLLELADELMLIAGTDGFLRRVSTACTRVLGWSIDELLSRPCLDFVHPEDRPALLAASLRVAAGERLMVQSRVQCKSGAWRTLLWSASPVNLAAGTFCAVGRDLSREHETTEHLEHIIDQRTRAEERLLASLEEKAVLLREIHHRVKNNLSVIASQLYLQSTYATDAATIQMLHEMRDRVRSMALVHETLYESDSLASIDVAGYVRALADHLLRSYRSPLIRVALEVDIAPVELSVEAAIPCGLILTELITNSLKHAFLPGSAGRMRVSLLVEDDGRLRFEVTDNGVGMPDDIDVSTTRSLGLRLVRSLVAQLDGEFEIRPGVPGTRVRLSFEAPACPERHDDDC